MSPKITLYLQIATQYKTIPPQKIIKQWIAATFKQLRMNKNLELGIRIVNKAESQTLNQQYRHKVGPTNVLSFPFVTSRDIKSSYLGDLVICAPLVAQEAKVQNKNQEAHWAHLVIHGVLHLLGYDHIKKNEAVRMEKLETDILAKLDYPNPY